MPLGPVTRQKRVVFSVSEFPPAVVRVVTLFSLVGVKHQSAPRFSTDVGKLNATLKPSPLRNTEHCGTPSISPASKRSLQGAAIAVGGGRVTDCSMPAEADPANTVTASKPPTSGIHFKDFMLPLRSRSGPAAALP